MSNQKTSLKPASGEEVPKNFLDYLEEESESVSEGVYEEESEEDKPSDRCTPPLPHFGVPGTKIYGPGPGSEFGIGVSQPMSPPLASTSTPTPKPTVASPRIKNFRIMTSPLSPRRVARRESPETSRDSEHWAALGDEDAFRSRSPLPGTSRDSLSWEPRKDDDVVLQEEWLDEELLAEEDELLDEGEGWSYKLTGMPVEMDVVDPTPLLNESERCQDEHKMRRRVFREEDDSGDDYDPDSELGLFGGDGAALNFDWSPMETFQGSQEQFMPETTGPVRNFLDPYDAFRAYWDDDILQHVVVETNRYAAAIASHSVQFARKWTDTNVDEIMILFAFWMTLGLVKFPTIESCFSKNPIFQTNPFTRLFTKQRYFLLNRAIHFVDNSTRTPQSSRLFSLGPVLEHLKAKFMNLYTPGQDISIDESLTLWKGNLVFKQYIGTKAARVGIKTFELCEAATGYLWAFNVYTGKDTSVASSSSLPKSTKVVLDLVTPLLNKGHRLFMDNWFNSPILARYLKRNRTDSVGMLRNNRRNVPPLIRCATLPMGHFVAWHAGDVVVMAYQGTKTVYTISTCHGVDMVQVSARPGRPSHYKPTVIWDYNHSIKKDHMLEPYLVERKRCVKWSRQLFKRLLNDSIVNSRILLQSSGDQRPHLVFWVDLVDQIVSRHLSHVPQPRLHQVLNRIPGMPAERLIGTGSHYPVWHGDPNEPLTSGHRISKNGGLCIWCRVVEMRYSRTVYKCEFCNVYLCIECFKNYHTKNV